jgi:hypothetical protein
MVPTLIMKLLVPKKKNVPTSRFIDRDVASFVAVISEQYLLFVSLFANCGTNFHANNPEFVLQYGHAIQSY